MLCSTLCSTVTLSIVLTRQSYSSEKAFPLKQALVLPFLYLSLSSAIHPPLLSHLVQLAIHSLIAHLSIPSYLTHLPTYSSSGLSLSLSLSLSSWLHYTQLCIPPSLSYSQLFIPFSLSLRSSSAANVSA